MPHFSGFVSSRFYISSVDCKLGSFDRLLCRLTDLFMILERGHLREASPTKFAVKRFLASVGSHVSLKTRRLEESLATVLAEVGPLVVVLFPVKNGGVPVAELSPAVLALVDLAH